MRDALTRIATVGDRENDVGPTAPRYADVLQVLVEGGSRSARFTVTFGGAVPERLSKGETLGIGIDLGKPGSSEGSYQLYADGGARGWFAYLYTPHGFVRYPGTFVLSGNRIAFHVPWSSIGGLRNGRVKLFCEWSGKKVALGIESEDDAPDSGTAEYGG